MGFFRRGSKKKKKKRPGLVWSAPPTSGSVAPLPPRSPVRARPKVEYLPGQRAESVLLPHPLIATQSLESLGREADTAALTPDRLWQLRFHCSVERWLGNHRQHELPYLQGSWVPLPGGKTTQGDPIFFMGMTRVDEQTSSGKLVSIPRPVFMHPALGMFMVADMNLVRPL